MLIGAVLLLLAPAAACSSTGSIPTSVASAPAGDMSSTPAPSLTARTKAEDAADVKKALVTAADLGTPWVKPKTVSRAGGKKGEICPGHVSALRKVPFTAEA